MTGSFLAIIKRQQFDFYLRILPLNWYYFALMKIFLSIIFLLLSASSWAQTDKALLTTVQEQAQKMSDAFHSGDYETFMDFTHPQTIEDIGGRENMKKLISGGLGRNIKFISTEVMKAKKLFKKGDIIQCAMKQDQIIEVDGKRYLIAGWLIGISYDAGAKWSYISVSNYTLKHLLQFFPELSKKLPVKPQKEPKPVKN